MDRQTANNLILSLDGPGAENERCLRWVILRLAAWHGSVRLALRALSGLLDEGAIGGEMHGGDIHFSADEVTWRAALRIADPRVLAKAPRILEVLDDSRRPPDEAGVILPELGVALSLLGLIVLVFLWSPLAGAGLIAGGLCLGYWIWPMVDLATPRAAPRIVPVVDTREGNALSRSADTLARSNRVPVYIDRRPTARRQRRYGSGPFGLPTGLVLLFLVVSWLLGGVS